MKTILTTALVLLSAQFASARQIYWTGEATSYESKNDCEYMAGNDGLSGARNSCVYDYRLSEDFCALSQPVSQQLVGVYRNEDGSISCKVRVYINIP